MGKQTAPKTQTVVNETKLPAWVDSAAQAGLTQAQNVAANLQAPYTGNQVPGFNSTQTGAWGMAQGAAGAAQPGLNAAQGALTGLLGSTAPQVQAPAVSGTSVTAPAGINAPSIGAQQIGTVPQVGTSQVGTTNISAQQLGAAPQVGTSQVGTSAVEAQQLGAAPQVGTSQVGTIGVGTNTIADRQLGVQGSNIGAQQVQAGQFSAEALGKYLDPYTSQVVDASLSDLDRQRQLANNQTAGQAASAGAFGGSRQAIQTAVTNAESARAGGLLSAQLRSQAFNTAAGLLGQDQNRALQADTSNQAANLTASQANQANALEAQRLNQTTNLSATSTDAANRLSASQSNASNFLAASQANAANTLAASGQNASNAIDVGKANQAAALAASGQNASNTLAASQANAANSLTASQANASNAIDVGKANQAADLAAQTTNAGNALSASTANAANSLTAAGQNATNWLNASATNAANSLTADRANQDASMTAQQANMAAQLQALLANQANAIDVSKTNAANSLAGQVANQNAATEGQKNGILGAAQLASTAQQQMQNQLTQATVNEGIGDRMQQREAALLAQDAANYNATRNQDLEKLNIQLAALGMVPYGQTSTTTGPATQQGSNPLMGALGGAATGASIASTLGLAGGAGGGLFAGAGSLLGLLALSDETTKTDIQKVGKDPKTGLALYAYRYKGDRKNTPKVVGPMAQDVAKKFPDQVVRLPGKGGKLAIKPGFLSGMGMTMPGAADMEHAPVPVRPTSKPRRTPASGGFLSSGAL